MSARRELTVLPLAIGGLGALAGAFAAGRGQVLGVGAGVCALAAGIIGARTRTQTINVPVPATSAAPTALPTGSTGPAGGVGDNVTGLFNEHYFTVAVDSRVAAARRHLRPVAIILLTVGRPGAPGELADPVAVSAAIRATLRDSDTACHLDDGRFGVILEDTPEDGAILTAERLRRALGTAAPDFVQRAGVACYPAHAFNTGELLTKAEAALAAACDWPQHRIEVAIAD
jgi:GGDEF domain-containing protein